MQKQIKSACLGWVLSLSCAVLPALAQSGPGTEAPGTVIPLNDLSAFKSATPNWRIVGDISADLARPNTLITRNGTGVLANLPVPPKKGQSQYGDQYNLQTNAEHGDVDLELDFMMAKGANSGVYLQGRYEIQLFDSWGVQRPTVVDNGSIYERWDDKRPDGQQGYEGYAARQNASRAPGLWQHLSVSFQAPHFDASGRKTDNARLLRVELNGVLIHENVSLTGPTRSASFTNEKATGPLMLQGDHGAVAFRNIRYTPYGKSRPELSGLTYSVYAGKFEQEPDYANLTVLAKGTSKDLSATVSPRPNEFLIRYTGTMQVQEPGSYRLGLSLPGGVGFLRINQKPVITNGVEGGTAQVDLPAGNLPVDLVYAKSVEWEKANIGLTVSGPGIRRYLLTNPLEEEPATDPILVPATTNTVLRSFMDIPGVPPGNTPGQKSYRSFRVTHAVSVGSPEQVHYTYDLNNGSVVQVWRGMFLDATPMWNNRGDGSSRPMGMVQRFGMPALMLARLASEQAAWPADTTGSSFRPKGYSLDEQDRPTFRYQTYGAAVQDQLRVLDNSTGVRRELTIANSPAPLYARLAHGTRIDLLETGLYRVDGETYVRIDSSDGTAPVVRTLNGKQELIAPVKSTLTYSILF